MTNWTQRILCRIYGHEWMFTDNPFTDTKREPLAPVVCQRCSKRGTFPQTSREILEMSASFLDAVSNALKRKGA